ncbi:MAG TPA: 2-succinyl-6-hydroxy-2,4-cyclohexadiene-1-carboxylate synthase [Solirubrobacteraceae bacterium]|nr:2-succinyl-6-hydroxy-2,4-cyclohexadiene-1-carboxylate synthase [Solirubrobacteraceae bacterium]
MSEFGVQTPETLVLLHGFGGTRHTWDRVVALLDPQRYRPLALDLPGHGELASYKRPITFAGCVQMVLAAAPSSFALCGYSLGGRVALHVALAAPERVSRLLLISTSPGIEDAVERARRREADNALAERLEHEPLESFIDSWSAQPLFATDPSDVLRLAEEDQRRNHARSLAAALRGLGTGEMDSLWVRLGELTMPVTILVGERDAKYRMLGERMSQQLPRARLLTLAGGHRLALECPQELARALASRL